MQQVVVEQRRWNVAGVVGFVLSALGLIGCCVPFFNLVAIPGLILSFVGLFRPHRVLAVLGVLIGLIGSLLAIVITLVWVLLLIVGETFGGLGQFAHVAAINGGLEQYRDRTGVYPTQLSQLPIDAEWRVDRWGHPFVYESAADGQTFLLRSVGPDGALNTADDINYSHMITGRRHRVRFGPGGIHVSPEHHESRDECGTESRDKDPL